MQTYENKDEISIFELFDIFRRNLVLIIRSVIISLLIALLFSGVTFFLNRNVETYSLTTKISLSGSDLSEQKVSIITNTFSHSSTVSPSFAKLDITSSDYSVISKRSDEVGILQLIVEGPNASKLTNLSNGVFNLVKPLIETAFPTVELRKLEISSPIVVPQTTLPNVDWVLNSILGVVLGGMLSVFYIFAMYFMSPNIIQDNELESLFNTKILGRFADKPKKETLTKFFEVR